MVSHLLEFMSNPVVRPQRMSSEFKYEFKCLTIGDSGVGKSSIIHRFTNNTFTGTFLPTIGIDYKIKTMQVPNKGEPGTHNVRLCLWDTAGQERFRTITKSCKFIFKSIFAWLTIERCSWISWGTCPLRLLGSKKF